MFYNLGDSKIKFDYYLNKPGYFLFMPHPDELSPFQVANNFKKDFNFLRIKGSAREVFFSFKNKKYFFDPNRIFIKIGIERYFKKTGQALPQEVVNLLLRFGQILIKKVEYKKTIIALHSNIGKGFNINYYKNNPEAKEMYVNIKEDPSDLIVVTEKKDYDYLKSLKYNVALQNKVSQKINDGSLSVFAKQKGIRYFNIEVKAPKYKVSKKGVAKQTQILNQIIKVL